MSSPEEKHEALEKIEADTALLIKRSETSNTNDAEVGLEKHHISSLINGIISSTNSEYAEDSLQRSLNQRRPKTLHKYCQIKVSPVIFDLKVGSCKRLIEALIPKEPIHGEDLVRICHWAMGNRDHLNEPSILLPVLRWINCILHYELCTLQGMESLYELFLQSLHKKNLRAVLLDILYKITGQNKNEVTTFRVKHLLQLRLKHGEIAELENLLKRYKMLNPSLIGERLKNTKTVPTFLNKGAKTKMEKNFESYWAKRSPQSKTQGANTIAPYSRHLYRMDSTAFGKIPLDYGFQEKGSLLPSVHYVEPYNTSRVSKQNKDKSKDDSENKRLIKLSECKTLGDMFANVHQLSLPCQAMSLIASPHLCYLIFLNPNATELKERLSFTLYSTLYNEFFSQTSGRGDTIRKTNLLCRINDLQEWLQSGIPVVYRFLAEYLAAKWNGSDFFLEILRLLAYLPITEFDELDDCVLTHIKIHYNSKFTTIQQLMVLTYLNKLILHWSVVEYKRTLIGLGRDRTTRTFRNENRGEPEKRNTAEISSGLLDDGRFFASSEKFSSEEEFLSKENKKRFVGEDNWCTTPLKSIYELTELFKQWTELALLKIKACDTRRISPNTPKSTHRLHFTVFINEVLAMYLSMARCFVQNKIPIKISIPASVIYMCFFSPSVHFIAAASQYISILKNELRPMCKDMEREEEVSDIGCKFDASRFNLLCIDIMAVFVSEKINIERESIFRKYWEIEHSQYLNDLSLISHPAFLSYTIKFCEQRAAESENDSSYKDIYQKLEDSDSYERKLYMEGLKEKAPSIFNLYKSLRDLFAARIPNTPNIRMANSTTSNTTKMANSTISNTTSGVSSMRPSTRRISSNTLSIQKKKKIS